MGAPRHLNPLLRTNPRRLYALLFASAAATLQHCSRRRGIERGITMVLHTWGQTLTSRCPLCGGPLRVVEVLAPHRHDTS